MARISISFVLYLFTFVTILSACEPQSPTEVQHSPTEAEDLLESIWQKQAKIHAEQAAEDLGLPEGTEYSNEPTFKIKLPPKQLCDENLLLTLVPELSENELQQIRRARWVQVGGPPLTILEPGNISTRIIAPSVQQTEIITLRLSTQTSDGSLQIATTTLEVHPLDSSINISSEMASEDEGALVFSVQLKQPANQLVTLNYTTEDSQARGDTDYQAVSGTVGIPQGQSTGEIIVNINDDEFREASETFKLNVSAVIDGARINKSAYGVIQDDEEGEVFVFEKPIDTSDLGGLEESFLGLPPRLGFYLLWGNTEAELELTVVDVCGNKVNRDSPNSDCNGEAGLYSEDRFSSSSDRQISVNFESGEQITKFKIFVEHLKGTPTDYKLVIVRGDSVSKLTGNIGGGQQIAVGKEDAFWLGLSASELFVNDAEGPAVGGREAPTESTGNEQEIEGPLPLTIQKPRLRSVSIGESHALYIKPDGGVLCWGDNTHDQCNVPKEIGRIVSVIAGRTFSAAINDEGKVYAWGRWVLDYSPYVWENIEVPPFEGKAVQIEAGLDGLGVLTDGGEIIVWGPLTDDPTYYELLAPGPEKYKYLSFSLNAFSILALSDEGDVVGWGRNHKNRMVFPYDRTDIVSVKTHQFINYALTSAGEVLEWGRTSYTDYNVPKYPAMKYLQIDQSGRVTGEGLDGGFYSFRLPDPPKLMDLDEGVVAYDTSGNQSLITVSDEKLSVNTTGWIKHLAELSTKSELLRVVPFGLGLRNDRGLSVYVQNDQGIDSLTYSQGQNVSISFSLAQSESQNVIDPNGLTKINYFVDQGMFWYQDKGVLSLLGFDFAGGINLSKDTMLSELFGGDNVSVEKIVSAYWAEGFLSDEGQLVAKYFGSEGPVYVLSNEFVKMFSIRNSSGDVAVIVNDKNQVFQWDFILDEYVLLHEFSESVVGLSADQSICALTDGGSIYSDFKEIGEESAPIAVTAQADECWVMNVNGGINVFSDSDVQVSDDVVNKPTFSLENLTRYDFSGKTFAAVDSGGKALVWGDLFLPPDLRDYIKHPERAEAQ